MSKKLKIAVCLYGQPRHLEYTSAYIKKYYDNKKYDIDYFCSTKSYYEWFSDKRKADTVHEENDEKIKNSITQLYEPKAIRVIPSVTDELHDADKIQKIHLAFIDCILLKSEYEAANNFHYDITILQRYDSIIYPMNGSLDFIVNSLIKSKTFTNPNHLFHFRMNNNDRRGNVIKMIQDVAFFSIGNSMDIMASELLKYSGKYAKKCNNNNTPSYLIKNIHILLYDIFSKNNIVMHQFDNATSETKVNVTIIRDGLEHLNILERNTWFAYTKLWAETQRYN